MKAGTERAGAAGNRGWPRLAGTLALLAALAAPMLPAAAAARPGALDHGFSGDGRLVVKVPAPPVLNGGYSFWGLRFPPMASDTGPGGEIVATDGRTVLVRRPDGHPRRRFGGDGRVRIPVAEGMELRLADLAVDSRGRILVAGSEAPPSLTPGPPGFPGPPAARASVYRFLPDGRLDRGFGSGGASLNDFGQLPPTGPGLGDGRPFPRAPAAGDKPQLSAEFPYATASVGVRGLAVDAEDRPVLTGYSVSRVTVCGYDNPQSAYMRRTYVARLTVAGAPDPSFGANGVVTDPHLEDPGVPALTRGGGVVFPNPEEQLCPRVAEGIPPVLTALDSAGSFRWRVPTIAGGTFESFEPRGLSVDRRGRIVLLVVGGSGEGPGRSTTVRRLLPSGAPDPRFGRAGTVVPRIPRHGAIATLATDARNRVLLAGSAARRGGRGFLLVRLSAAGHPQRRFGRSGRVVTGFGGRALARQAHLDRRGRIVVAGTVATPKLPSRFGLAFARYEGR